MQDARKSPAPHVPQYLRPVAPLPSELLRAGGFDRDVSDDDEAVEPEPSPAEQQRLAAEIRARTELIRRQRATLYSTAS